MNELEVIGLVLTIIFGLIIGSFLNVLIYRIPNQMSIISPASHCPNCQHSIAWYDNIPIISYIILKGKCRYCKQNISSRYLVVELLNASLWVLALHYYQITELFFLSIIVISLLIVIAFIDLDKMIIPDSLNLSILIIGVLSIVLKKNFSNILLITQIDQLIGLVIGLILLLIVVFIDKIFKKEVMGGGDIKLIGAIGLFLGWQLVLLGIILGSMIGTLIELPQRLVKIKKESEPFPFGPYLVIGFLIAMYVGPSIINWYIHLIR